MTVRETVKAISALGISCQYRDGEFRVALRLPGNRTCEMSAYYTRWAQDALETAQAMRRYRDSIDSAI